jgi:hypothetical protein
MPPTERQHRTTRPLRRRLAIRFAALMRWVHIYVSMFGLFVTLFFSVTGLTLNHPRWFNAHLERSEPGEGHVDPHWLNLPSGGVDQLRVVEHLRQVHGVGGALAEFRVEPDECSVSFRSPAYSADAFIQRQSGDYTLTQTYHGFVAVLNELHKGRDAGPVWSVVIDASAVLLTVISLSGLVLLFYLKLRRVWGVVVAVAGAVAVVALIRWFVPR